jgi:hypothetical protein
MNWLSVLSAYVQRDGVLPDVIECQEYAALPYYLIQRRLVERHLLSDVPLVLHLHSPNFCITRANRQPRYRLPGYWVGRMERFCLLAAEGILSPSAFLAREVAGEMPQRADAIEIIPYPYPPLPASATTPQRMAISSLQVALSRAKGCLNWSRCAIISGRTVEIFA